MRTAIGVALIAAVLCMTGCAGVTVAPVMPPFGFIYTNTQAPLDVTTTPAKEMGTKRGEASTQCILGMFAWGDGSMKAATDNGGIKTIRHADYLSLNVLFIYSKYTTVVYGE